MNRPTGKQIYQVASTPHPTELIISPREFHGLIRSGFVRDRYQRYLAWYDNLYELPIRRK